MSHDIAPGDWVECIANDTQPGGLAISVGSLYQVSEIADGVAYHTVCDNCGTDTADGVELTDPQSADGWKWCICSFRPIYRPNERLTESLLAFKAEKAPANAA